jgi:hypothetical protein
MVPFTPLGNAAGAPSWIRGQRSFSPNQRYFFDAAGGAYHHYNLA